MHNGLPTWAQATLWWLSATSLEYWAVLRLLCGSNARSITPGAGIQWHTATIQRRTARSPDFMRSVRWGKDLWVHLPMYDKHAMPNDCTSLVVSRSGSQLIYRRTADLLGTCPQPQMALTTACSGLVCPLVRHWIICHPYLNSPRIIYAISLGSVERNGHQKFNYTCVLIQMNDFDIGVLETYQEHWSTETHGSFFWFDSCSSLHWDRCIRIGYNPLPRSWEGHSYAVSISFAGINW